MSSINYSAFRSRKAFTIIEILVVITVISTLIGVTTISLYKYQVNARDSVRQSKTTIIAAALERYYSENFEYPSCPLITDTPANVKSHTLTSLADPTVLKAPLAANGVNSVVCSLTVPASPQDAFAYSCTNNTSCAKWQIKYRKESDGSIVTISSAHSGNSAADGGVALGAPTINITAVLSGTDAVGTATASCSSGAPEYQIHYYKNNGTFPGAWTDASSATASPVTEGESATFQAQARCVQTGVASSGYAQSSIVTASRAVVAPSGLTTSVVISGSNAVATVNGGSCTGGTTLHRQIRSMTEGSAFTGTWTAYADIAGTSQTLPVNEGWQYTFQQQAQCLNQTTGVGSTWTVDTAVTALRPISTLVAPPLSVSGNSSNVHWDWSGAGGCPTGTTKEYQWYRTGSWGGTFGWWGPIPDTFHDWPDTSQGYTFNLQVQQRCTTGYAQGAWSASGSASYARPITAPGVPYGFGVDRVSNTGIAFNWTAPACGTATQPQWHADWANQGGGGITWISPPSGHTSYWWYGGNAYAESYANPSSAWTNALPSYGYMGDRNNQYAVNPPKMNLDPGTVGAFDSNNYIAMAVEYRCVNPTSGLIGPTGPVNSLSYMFP
jgi:prepilin-type N-terminal cleavage/methylation domain-containing protein